MDELECPQSPVTMIAMNMEGSESLDDTFELPEPTNIDILEILSEANDRVGEHFLRKINH